MTTRRFFMGLLGAGLGSLAAAPALKAAGTTTAARPNIVFFMVDDMGWQDTSVPFWYRSGVPVTTLLNRRYKTPNMEAMAKNGMLFTDAYAHAVCSPTRCSLMSGMSPARHRVIDWTMGVNKRFGGTGEGLTAPNWAGNGLQPVGTRANGTCPAPWRCTGFEANVSGGTFAYGTDPVGYGMTVPFVSALTLPQVLKEAGYHTIHCGKAHWGSGNNNWNTGEGMSTPGADPRSFGFDVNIAGCEAGNPFNYRSDAWFGNKDGYRQTAVPGLSEYYGKTFKDLTHRAEGIADDRPVFLTDALTDKALLAVDAHLNQHPDRPFYLCLSHYGVHVPLENPTTWDAARSASEANHNTENPNDGRDWTPHERNYANLIRGMDDSLGTLRRYLRDKGLEKNTLIVFFSDNGGVTGSSGRMDNANLPLRAGKGSWCEGGIRECCLAEWPDRIGAGRVSHEPILVEDFYPTLLEAAGIPLPGTERLAVTPGACFGEGEADVRQVLDGESVLPVMLGRRATVRENGAARPLLWHLPTQWGGPNSVGYNFYTVLRLGRWKLVYQHSSFDDPAKAFELYDLRNDIGESVSLAAKRPDLVQKLGREMDRLLKERGAQMPTRTADGTPVPLPGDVLPKADDPRRGVLFSGR